MTDHPIMTLSFRSLHSDRRFAPVIIDNYFFLTAS